MYDFLSPTPIPIGSGLWGLVPSIRGKRAFVIHSEVSVGGLFAVAFLAYDVAKGETTMRCHASHAMHC